MDLKEEDLLKRNVKGISEKLKKAKICILGLGGLGSNVATLLARSGIGYLKLVDFDIVEASNLNRQQYRISHIGIKKTEAIRTIIKEINPFVEIETLDVKVDREKMTSLGLNIASVGKTMQIAFSGNTDSKYRAGEYEYDINIRYDEIGRSSIDDVKNLKFVSATGQVVRLEQFADISYGSGPSLLERRDKTPSVSVQAKAIGRPAGTIAAEWEQQFSKIQKKAGVEYRWRGNMENQQEGFGTLGFALLAAIVLMYLVMVALYDSFATPFIVIFSVPLSFIGALLLMALTNQTLNIFTILGIIMLIGLVAKNAIMLVDFANNRKAVGDSTFDALVAANQARFRPILMTTIAMVVGMIPIAMASGDGADMNRGVAIVIIGGLISSLFLTLIVIPVVYSIFDSLERRFSKGEKTDYAKEMVADYEANADFKDEFAAKQ